MNITVGMPVKPYLKKYVYWKENIKEGEKVLLNSDSSIRMVLAGLLTGKIKPQQNQSINYKTSPYTDELLCQIPIERMDRSLLFYSDDHIKYFNTLLYKTFHDDLLYIIMTNLANGIEETITIHAFIDSVGIFDLISFDALKKASYRLRKKRNLPVFHIRNSKIGENPYTIGVLKDSA